MGSAICVCAYSMCVHACVCACWQREARGVSATSSAPALGAPSPMTSSKEKSPSPAFLCFSSWALSSPSAFLLLEQLPHCLAAAAREGEHAESQWVDSCTERRRGRRLSEVMDPSNSVWAAWAALSGNVNLSESQRSMQMNEESRAMKLVHVHHKPGRRQSDTLQSNLSSFYTRYFLTE